MRVESVISNSITQEIRLKGHQSIRFAPDGFSVLISDADFVPVVLNHYYFESPPPVEDLVSEFSRLLDKSDRVFDRTISKYNIHLVYAVNDKIIGMGNRFAGNVKTVHTSECLLSLSDQVNAGDHIRGGLMAEVQTHTLDVLVMANNRIQLLNRYALNDTSDFIYHLLNTMRQLELDRESVPVYLSGIVHEEHELKSLLLKYIRNVVDTPYYLEHLNREQTLRYMILSEGSKCA